MKFIITIFRDKGGTFIAECVSIPGCVSQGRGEQEAQNNIRDAIRDVWKCELRKGCR